MAKLSASLEDRLRTALPGELLDVIIEVKDRPPTTELPADKSSRYAALERNFRASTAAITHAIGTIDGTVLGHAWLGGAIKVRIPANRVGSLLMLDGVTVIDLPGRITR